MIYSFIEAKLDEHFFKYENPFSRQELAELIWLISHQNILQLKNRISDDRYYMMRFEDVLLSPKEELEKLCDFLSIDFDAEMLKPYSGKKMTTGITPEKQMVGDFKFYLRNNIDTGVIDKWKNYIPDYFFLFYLSVRLVGYFDLPSGNNESIDSFVFFALPKSEEFHIVRFMSQDEYPGGSFDSCWKSWNILLQALGSPLIRLNMISCAICPGATALVPSPWRG